MTVVDMLKNMSSYEVSEWMAFDNLKDENYRAKIKAETMTLEERDGKLKNLLGFK